MPESRERINYEITKAEEEHVSQVADKVAKKVKSGKTTVLIRHWVIAELTPMDARAAEAYKNYKKPGRK